MDPDRDPRWCPAKLLVDILLRPVYGPGLWASNCERSVSLVSRPDPFFAVLTRRSTRRTFLFEKADPLGVSHSLVGALEIRCGTVAEMEELARVRRLEHVTYCAAGYLRPPTYMTSDRGYCLPLEDFYSTHVGLEPFPCTPYMSHHSFFGYVCAQAAVYLCLEMMFPLGAAPHSPATLSHIVTSMRGNEEPDAPPGAMLCTEHAEDRTAGADGYFCRGLYANEITLLLKDENLKTLGLQFDAAMGGTQTAEVAMKHIKAMLLSRLPIIAFVDYDSVAKAVRLPAAFGRREAHVITIVGYRERPGDEEPKVIFHDGHLGPYREIGLTSLIDAAENAPDESGAPELGVIFFSPLPETVSAKGYVDLFYEAWPDNTYDYGLRLSSTDRIRSHLARYAPGQVVVSDVKSMLGAHVTDSNPLWLLEYKNREAGDVYLDVIDGARSNERRRIGTVCLGRRTYDDPWFFVRATESECNVRRSMYREVDGVEETKKEIIRRA